MITLNRMVKLLKAKEASLFIMNVCVYLDNFYGISLYLAVIL